MLKYIEIVFSRACELWAENTRTVRWPTAMFDVPLVRLVVWICRCSDIVYAHVSAWPTRTMRKEGKRLVVRSKLYVAVQQPKSKLVIYNNVSYYMLSAQQQVRLLKGNKASTPATCCLLQSTNPTNHKQSSPKTPCTNLSVSSLCSNNALTSLLPAVGGGCGISTTFSSLLSQYSAAVLPCLRK